MPQRWFLIFSATAAMGVAPDCYAATAPNPGGSTVITNSTTATATYVPNPVTQLATTFATTITALLSGSTVYSMQFALPFTDPMVQAAVAAADSVLAGDGATYGAPILASSATTTSSSTVQAAPPSLTCAQLLGGTFTINGNASVTSTQTFGPATISVGDCQQDSFTILPGQLDININTDFGYDVPVDVVTTTTTLTTQLYQITGLAATTPPSTSVPEPATAGLLLAGLAMLGGTRRRR